MNKLVKAHEKMERALAAKRMPFRRWLDNKGLAWGNTAETLRQLRQAISDGDLTQVSEIGAALQLQVIGYQMEVLHED